MRAVLIAIADAANRDGEHAHPGINAICESALYSRSHVFDVIKRLVADRWLEVEEEANGRGNATVYRVLMDRLLDPLSNGKGPLGLDPLFEKGSNPEPERVQSVDPSPSYTTDLTTCPPSSTSDATRLANLFADQIAERGNKRPSVTKAWVESMDRLIRIDNRAPERIETVLRWLATASDPVASFWRTNVRSPEKLRERWDQMAEQYRDRVKQHAPPRPIVEAVAPEWRQEVEAMEARLRAGGLTSDEAAELQIRINKLTWEHEPVSG